jgi:restriction system protein
MDPLLGLVLIGVALLWVVSLWGTRRKKQSESEAQLREEEHIRLVKVKEKWHDRRLKRQIVKEKENKVLGAATALVRNHAATLYRKKLQKTKHDDYGNTSDTEWRKEMNYFYKAVIFPRVSERFTQSDLEFFTMDIVETLIEAEMKNYAQGNTSEDENVDRLTPIDFEAHCASLLSRSGWLTRTTRASGDQGIDIIGEKDGIKAVFQVKQSSSPVGNKAVQEAIAGKAFVNADTACVVSNAGYTASAKELASISNVSLLHHTELTRLRIKRQSPAAR